MKKILSIVLASILLMGQFIVSSSAGSLRKLDLAFVIDTTGSMEDDIYKVKSDMKEYLDDLNSSGMDYKIAIVDYRDFSERAGAEDYPYKVQLDFSNNYDDILNAINGLNIGNGGDADETICSALIDGLSQLSWRGEAGKTAILMGDAPALDPEPYTNYTKDMAINKLLYDDTAYSEDIKPDSMTRAMNILSRNNSSESIKRSKVTLFTIATTSSSDTVSDFEYLATKTGGKNYQASSTSDISVIVKDIIQTIPDVVEDNQPSFWERLGRFFMIIFYIITFQWSKI